MLLDDFIQKSFAIPPFGLCFINYKTLHAVFIFIYIYIYIYIYILARVPVLCSGKKKKEIQLRDLKIKLIFYI